MSENGTPYVNKAARRSDVARQDAVDAAHAKQVEALGKPSGFALALQEFDRSEERASRSEPPVQFRSGDGPAVQVIGLQVQSIRGCIFAAELPGGNFTLDTTHTVRGLIRSLGGPPHIEIERADISDAIAALQAAAGLVPPGETTPVIPSGAIVLTGPDADRYRALQSAAQAAHEATRAAQTAGAALRDAFAAFCAGAAPTKEP